MTATRKLILLVGDIAMLAGSLVAMLAIRFNHATDGAFIARQTKLFVLLFALWLVVFFIFDLYNFRRVNPTPRTVGLLALAVLTSALLSVLVFYISSYKGITPKTNLAIVAGFSFFLLTAWRRFFYAMFASRLVQKIALIGHGPAIEHLAEDLSKNPHIGKVVSIHREFESAQMLPDIDTVITHDVPVTDLMEISREKNSEVFSLFEAYEELLAKIPLALVTEEKALDILTRRNRFSYQFIERVFEVILASLVLIIASPFLILAALAIFLQDFGPIFYTQLRVGKNGVPFKIYKLRSMIVDSEKAGAQWAEKNDARTTAIGALLRKLHIDELPQMINVLKGDLAFVGPRPERPEFVSDLEKQIPYYFLRHTIKPGFTGWAQIKFRYARTVFDSQEKFEYDLYYLLNKSPLFDAGIFLKTVQIIFTH